MERIWFALVVFGILLAAGCAAPAEENLPPALEQQVPPIIQANHTPINELPAETAPPAIESNKTPSEPAAEPALPVGDNCTIEFQKDASSVYYVMVKTSSAKELSVTCPNAKNAEKVGGLFFCSELDLPSQIIAYLGGAECARANFSSSTGGLMTMGGSKISCSITLSDSRITMGDSVVVTAQTSSGSRQIEVAYNCGDEVKTQRRSGLVTDGAICKFDTPGTIEIYLMVDGKVCATQALQVFEKPKECSVLSNKFERFQAENGSYVYTSKVMARGYSSSDKLSYSCYGDSHSTPLWQMEDPTYFISQIQCAGPGPLGSPVQVKISGELCGEISP